MRAELGFIASQAALGVVGIALLYALGMVRLRARDLALALGPAYLAGLALVMGILTACLAVGIPATLASFAIVTVIATAALAAFGHWRRTASEAQPPAPRNAWWERLALVAVAVALAAYFAIGVAALPGSPVVVDNVGFWAPKALALHFYGALQPDVFLGAYPHQDYPVLQPLMQAIAYDAMDRAAVDAINVQLWMVHFAGIWTAAWLLAPRFPIRAWLPPLAVLAVLPRAEAVIKIGYADATLAAFCAGGALALGLWLQERRPRLLVLAMVLLAGAANTKNEGFAAAAVLLLAAAVVALGGRPRLATLRGALPGLAAAAALILPWRIWVSANGANADDFLPISETLRWDYLSERADRLELGFKAIADQLTIGDTWIWVAPAALLVLLVAVIAGRERGLAGYYLAGGLLTASALAWVYWTSDQDVIFHITTSVGRAVMAVVFVLGVGMAHVCGELIARHSDPGPGEGPGPPEPHTQR